jgi:hypothetical protein
MSVLSALCVFALFLVSAILSIAATLGVILLLAYRDPNAGYSYFAGRRCDGAEGQGP